MKTNLFLLFLLFSINLFSQANLESNFKDVYNNLESKKGFVLIGEAHEVAGTYETEALILNELSKNGYNTFLLEGGISEALILNEFLETGDETVLNFTRARGENYKHFIKDLKKIKAVNPAFKITGVDFERSICLEYIFKKWLKDINNPKLNPALDKLKKIKGKTSPKKVKEIFLSIKSEYHLYEEAFDKELKQYSSQLKKIIFNPVFQADFGFSSKKRDEAILQNLLNIDIEQLEKSVLIIGSNHFTNPKHFWSSFQIQTKERLQCLVILFAYKDCKNYLRKKKYSSEMPLINCIQEEDMKEAKIIFSSEEEKKMQLTQNENKLLIVKLIKQ